MRNMNVAVNKEENVTWHRTSFLIPKAMIISCQSVLCTNNDPAINVNMSGMPKMFVADVHFGSMHCSSMHT